MSSEPVFAELDDGRVHAQHGPIDLLITIDSDPETRSTALQSLHTSFAGLLAGLAADLPILRAPAQHTNEGTNPTSQRMLDATLPLVADGFITPMASVAGSVADTICEALWSDQMTRLIVNNGGDIAFRLAPNTAITVALADVVSGTPQGGVRISATDPVRGVATSGRHGRSLTMGIADSVTVLGATAAAADAAATVIASRADVVSSPRIVRRRASEIDASSDLGERMVVVHVDALTDEEIDLALGQATEYAQDLQRRGLITAAVIKIADRHSAVAATTTEGAAVLPDLSGRTSIPRVAVASQNTRRSTHDQTIRTRRR